MNTGIQLGLESCAADRHASLRGARLGLLMNRASIDRDFRLSCDLLNGAFPGQIAALLTPQHGLWGDAQANMVESDHGWHSRLNVPIHSLYSESRRPTTEMLSQFDVLVIDLQDVGTRVYTFVWTMLECLRACAEADVRVLVLDRPNPIGGRIFEGPVLQDEYRSFVGGASIPLRHGLTLGELAILFQRDFQIDVSLEVVRVQGWAPDRTFDSIGRTWMFPSPNLPRIESTLVYPGQVLLEGTNLSEGRGTTTPFEVVGAPFIDPQELIDLLAADPLPGLRLLPTYFRPTFDKWCGQLCGGVSLHVTAPDQFRPVRTTITILSAIRRRWPGDFQWLDPPYEYERQKPPIDIIFGSSRLRKTLQAGDSVAGLADFDADDWTERTIDIQLYDRSADSRYSDGCDGGH